MKFDLTNLKEITNSTFYPLYMNRDRYIVLCGGGDSGKSWFAADKLSARTLVAARDGYKHRFLVVRKTQPAIKGSAYKLAWSSWDKFGMKPPIASKIANPMELRNRWGTEYSFLGMDDPEKIKSIEGITGVWLEEPTELNAKDFWQIDLRLRGPTPSYKQIILSFNPIDEQNWIKKEFFDPRDNVTDVTPPDWPSNMTRKRIVIEVEGRELVEYATIHRSTYHDNRFATDADIAILEGYKYKDENYYKVYCLGEWGVLRGLIYENYTLIKTWPTRFEYHGYGLDFGYSNHPTAVVECGVDGDSIYIREHIYGKGLTNQAIGANLTECGISPDSVIVGDSAEPKSIEEIYRQGFNIHPCKKGTDSIRNGIARVKQYNLHVHESSINTIKELNAYKWAEDKNGIMLNKPVDAFNHSMDAMRYILTHLVGMPTATVDISGYDPKEERKEILNAEDYDMMNDDAVWDTGDEEWNGI